MLDSLHEIRFLNLAEPRYDPWSWWDTKYKIPILIFLPFSYQSLTWRSPRPPLVFWLIWVLSSIVTFLIIGIIFDMAHVLWCLILLWYIGSIELRDWTAFPMTALAFLVGLDLTLISGGRRIGLSLIFVFIGRLVTRLSIGIIFVLFRWRAMAFWIPRIDVPKLKRRLQVSLYLFITCLLYHFLPCI